MSERWKPSVTVAAIAGRRRADGEIEYLLVEEETPDGLRLNNPAGHLDPGESPEEGVAREALEETGRAFVPERLVGIYLARTRPAAGGDDVTWMRFSFAGSVGDPEPGRTLDAGIVRTLWMTLDELRASRERHRSPLLLRSVEDAAAGRAYPLEVIVTDPSVRSPRNRPRP